MEITSLDQLDFNKIHTYDEYYQWKFDERVELYNGKIFPIGGSPLRNHQELSLKFFRVFYDFFIKRKIHFYLAPFDVRLPNKNGEILTVVQPDLCVICDLEKLDDKGCLGAPDLIVEILSPGNTKREMNNKFDIYEEAGVLEYWLVHPTDKNVQVFVLENGKYIGLKPFTEGEILTSKTFP